MGKCAKCLESSFWKLDTRTKSYKFCEQCLTSGILLQRQICRSLIAASDAALFCQCRAFLYVMCGRLRKTSGPPGKISKQHTTRNLQFQCSASWCAYVSQPA